MKLRLVCLSAALMLSACGSSSTDTVPVESEGAGAPQQEILARGIVQLRGDGIGISGPLGTDLAFNSRKEPVVAELVKVLGDSIGTSSNGECGAGPMEMVEFAGGLTINLQDGALVGWFLDEAEGGTVQTRQGIKIGSTANELQAAYRIEAVESSTLGNEFTSEEGIGGFYTAEGVGQRVASLHAGINCFFR